MPADSTAMPRLTFRQYCHDRAPAITLAYCMFMGLGLTARFFCVGEMIISWWLQLAAAAAALMLVNFWLKQYWLALPCFILACLPLLDLIPYYKPLAVEAASGPVIRIVSSNVLHGNSTPDAVARGILRENPDIVCLLEINPRMERLMLADFSTAYPYHWGEARDDAFGILMFSKLRPLETDTLYLDEDGTPAVYGLFEKGGRKFSVYGMHPIHPLRPERHRTRNRELLTVAQRAGASPVPVIVCGDLNTTVFSPAFSDMRKAGNLRDAADGRGYQATWPARRGFIRFGIKIDHILIDPRWVARQWRVLPSVGSDHLPVFAELQLKE